jgi:hypothetical protein
MHYYRYPNEIQHFKFGRFIKVQIFTWRGASLNVVFTFRGSNICS